MEYGRDTLFSLLRENLDYTVLVDEKARREQMYQEYVRQMERENKRPTSLETTIFLSSGMSCRDEDEDFSPKDVKDEAKRLLGFLIKHSEFNFDTVVVSIGIIPNLYVESVSNMKQTEKDFQK